MKVVFFKKNSNYFGEIRFWRATEDVCTARNNKGNKEKKNIGPKSDELNV